MPVPYLVVQTRDMALSFSCQTSSLDQQLFISIALSPLCITKMNSSCIRLSSSYPNATYILLICIIIGLKG